VGLNSLKSLNLTNVYPNNKKKSNKVKCKPLELYELAGKNHIWWSELSLIYYRKSETHYYKVFQLVLGGDGDRDVTNFPA
jgi:hypothetical protein